MKFPFIKQIDSMDCGPSCINMIANYYGNNISRQKLREKCNMTKGGLSLLEMIELSKMIGFDSFHLRESVDILETRGIFPLIIHWRNNHFVVLFKIQKGKYFIADPSCGILSYTKEEFLSNWLHKKKDNKGDILFLIPDEKFFEDDKSTTPGIDKSKGIVLSFISNYLLKYKSSLSTIIFSFIVGGSLQLLFPFATQIIIDYGIAERNLDFINLLLVCLLLLYLGNTAIEFTRSWITVHLSSRINALIISDFLTKLMKLPMSYFENKVSGDLFQRIRDHQRIEEFINEHAVKTVFALFTILVLTASLLSYNLKLFICFVGFTVCELGWFFFFKKKLKVFENLRFNVLSEDHNKLVEIIQGMPEIKQNSIENFKRLEWLNIQSELFQINLKNLGLNRYLKGGALLFNYARSIGILYICSILVLQGHLTIGAMMASIFIVSQLNIPINQLISFFLSYEYTKLSIERLIEINGEEEDVDIDKKITHYVADFPSVSVRSLSFSYQYSKNPVLKNINIDIPVNKTTAIVGSSGSGKTTLLKILLKLYRPTEGQIFLGNNDLADISDDMWRQHCGAILQDGYLFPNTIAYNIALADESCTEEKLYNVCKEAHIHDFIKQLPQGFETKIGSEGIGLSQGQRQRILIARALYRNPDFLFLDEATNSLDSESEKQILENFEAFRGKKTIVVIAHRLSTVSHADQIVVLEKGEVVEYGSHSQLYNKGERYYELVENQLSLT